MSEVLRKSFQSDGGGALYDIEWAGRYCEITPENMVTFPNGEEVYITPPSWAISIDIHNATLTITGISDAVTLLHEELARLDPPQNFSDEEIVVSMPTGANHSKKGYNLRFTVSRDGIPPHIPHIDEYNKVDIVERNPYYVIASELEKPTFTGSNHTPTPVGYLLD